MTRLCALVGAVVVVAGVGDGAAWAQESNLAPVSAAGAQTPAGWSFTPSLTYAGGWDDNVLVRGNGDSLTKSFLNVINPRGSLDLNGRLTQLSVAYDGAFVLYPQLGSLNSYDQHASISGRRRVSPHVSVFVNNTAAAVPTTELAQFIGVPFVRTGSRLDDLRTGVEAAFSKRTSMVASYDFQWVQFDQGQQVFDALRGGHSHGGTLSIKHARTDHFSLTADYDFQHATIGAAAQAFDVQNVSAGGDYKLSDQTRLFASAGVSRLGVTETSEVRMGPAWRVGLRHAFRSAFVDVLYSRSFIPSYGFGGTMQNEEAATRFRVPLSRRTYTTGGVSWRRNDPLASGDLPLRSYWVEGNLGYSATPWVHLELFYAGTRQTIDRPGGIVDRNRIGFQITTAKPVRMK